MAKGRYSRDKFCIFSGDGALLYKAKANMGMTSSNSPKSDQAQKDSASLCRMEQLDDIRLMKTIFVRHNVLEFTSTDLSKKHWHLACVERGYAAKRRSAVELRLREGHMTKFKGYERSVGCSKIHNV
ncbi:hypothetical protein Plhal703r1_c15g0073151 [Plasmopara halstedii]